MAAPWHSFTTERTLIKLESSEKGISFKEAEKRMAEYGENSLPETKRDSILKLFINQFQSPLIYILVVASGIIFILGEYLDGSVILAVLIFNAIVGMFQEGRAQNTLLALKKYVETNATVLRDDKVYIIPDKDVVPGDIVLLQEGERIPADGRVIHSQSLMIEEASLTGESEPVAKIVETLENEDLQTSEQKNMVFRGTHVVSGSGKIVIVATGLSTVIGGIAEQISTVDTEIPLKANVRYLSQAIIKVVAAICSVLFIAGVIFGHSAREMFTTVVSIAVSIIPEGLPIVLTLVLATGVWRMSKRNALVKKLQAVEALGQARVIAVDKTGTITKNELVIRKVLVDNHMYSVSGSGYEPRGEIMYNNSSIAREIHPDLVHVGKLVTLSANSQLLFSEEEKKWKITGDPTEAAMVVFGEKIGFHKNDLLAEHPLVTEIPFDYKLKYHASVHKGEGNFLVMTGAPEAVMELCDKIYMEGEHHDLTSEKRLELEEAFVKMSSEGLRVIAVAYKEKVLGELKTGTIKSLTFMGFFGMQDTLRSEVAEAMERARDAGMRVVMITGDHRVTATAIAREAGIYHDGDTVVTGAEIEAWGEEELAGKLDKTSVFARVTPEHKMRIINAYKQRKEIVAMTGDGVNDAPSLVAADLGVAMGKIGTEVAKEASDIILLDDNFGSIISAVEEGRSIYKTIKKVILYLFSTSAGEVLTITAALFMGLPLPVLAAQIIWLNLVTDGFLDISLAMEPKEKGLLSGRFERPKKYLVDGLMIQRMIVMAVPMMIGTLYLFNQYYQNDLPKAWTISLTTLAVFQWFNAWNCRSDKKSIFQMNWFSNKFLVGATFIVIGLQLLAVYNPFLQKILRTVPLEASEWLIILPVAATIVVAEELRKFIYRSKHRS